MSATPYSDSHAERVRIVAQTYDPDALVVPHRKAVNLEIERDNAVAALRDCISAIDDEREECGAGDFSGERYVRWRKAAGLDTSNTMLSVDGERKGKDD